MAKYGQCAFCPKVAEFSGEHVWSEWIGTILGKKKYQVFDYSGSNQLLQYSKNTLDLKLPVVCRPCNNNWMSQLEEHHAKPAMARPILSDGLTTITKEQQAAIAKFAFKCMVVADHAAKPKRPPFFPDT